MKPLTMEDLEEVLYNILPEGFEINTDNDGQVIIHTAMMEDEDGCLFPMDLLGSNDDDEDESMFDDDTESYDESSDDDDL